MKKLFSVLGLLTLVLGFLAVSCSDDDEGDIKDGKANGLVIDGKNYKFEGAQVSTNGLLQASFTNEEVISDVESVLNTEYLYLKPVEYTEGETLDDKSGAVVSTNLTKLENITSGSATITKVTKQSITVKFDKLTFSVNGKSCTVNGTFEFSGSYNPNENNEVI